MSTPLQPESLLLTGNLYAALGSVDEAVLWYQRGLHQDAFNQQALLNLRMVLCLKKFHRGCVNISICFAIMLFYCWGF